MTNELNEIEMESILKEFEEVFLKYLLCFEVVESNPQAGYELRKYYLPQSEKMINGKTVFKWTMRGGNFTLAPYAVEMINTLKSTYLKGIKAGKEEAYAEMKKEMDKFTQGFSYKDNVIQKVG